MLTVPAQVSRVSLVCPVLSAVLPHLLCMCVCVCVCVCVCLCSHSEAALQIDLLQYSPVHLKHGSCESSHTSTHTYTQQLFAHTRIHTHIHSNCLLTQIDTHIQHIPVLIQVHTHAVHPQTHKMNYTYAPFLCSHK